MTIKTSIILGFAIFASSALLPLPSKHSEPDLTMCEYPQPPQCYQWTGGSAEKCDAELTLIPGCEEAN